MIRVRFTNIAILAILHHQWRISKSRNTMLALFIFIFHMRNIFGIQFRLQAHHVHSTI